MWCLETIRRYLKSRCHRGVFLRKLYYDPFEVSGDAKRFSYTFKAPHPVGQLEVEIQQPYTASDFVIEPPAMTRQSEGRDTTYHGFTYRRRGGRTGSHVLGQLRQGRYTAVRAQG